MKRSTLVALTLLAVTVTAVSLAARWRHLRNDLGPVPDAASRSPLPPAAATTANIAGAPKPAKGSARTSTDAERRDATSTQNSRPHWSNDPTLRALFEQKTRLSVQVTFGPFLRRHRIPPEIRDRLLRLWTEREEITEELNLLALEKRQSSTYEDRLNLRRRADAILSEGEKSILGSELATELQSYRQTQPIRDFVLNYAGEATLSGLAITAEQADQLEAMLIASPPGRTARTLDSVNWDAVTAVLPTVLSPQQIALLLPEVDARNASRTFSTTVFRIQGKIE